MRAQRVENAVADGDDGEPLTWAEVERQLERAARAERNGTSRAPRRRHTWAIPRPVAPWADPLDRAEPGGRGDPAEPKSPTDGPGSPDA